MQGTLSDDIFVFIPCPFQLLRYRKELQRNDSAINRYLLLKIELF